MPRSHYHHHIIRSRFKTQIKREKAVVVRRYTQSFTCTHTGPYKHGLDNKFSSLSKWEFAQVLAFKKQQQNSMLVAILMVPYC